MKGIFTALSLVAILALSACYTVKYDDYAEFERKEYAELAQFEGWLMREGLYGVVSTESLLRSATDWRACHAQPWAVPPAALWPQMKPTLKLLQAEIIPLIGPLAVESGWRAPDINLCVGGAPRSKHVLYQALDLTPVQTYEREELLDRLCAFWAEHGERWQMGLGTYSGTRFHIDTGGWRTWGPDYSAETSACLERDETPIVTPPAQRPIKAEGRERQAD